MPARSGEHCMNNKNLAEIAAGSLYTGRIVGHAPEGAWRVRTDAGPLIARCSDGCLLAPGKGDLALVISSGQDGYFIIQVLEKKEGRAVVALPENTEMRAGSGDGKLAICSGELSLSGGLLKTLFKRVATAAGVVENKAELLRETYKRRYEEVKEVKDSKLGRWRCLVDALLSLRGESVDVKS